MVPGAGEGDAEGIEAAKEGICDDLGVLLPAVVSAAFLKRFNSEYLEPSLRGTLETRSGSGFASCPADLGLRELEEEERAGRRCAVTREVVLICHCWH
jgi:hypothetical protein